MEKYKKRTPEEKKKILNRLNRIEGQIKGIKKMVDSDRECNDILVQLSAVNNAVKSLSNNVLESHLYDCISESILNGELDIYDDIVSLFRRFNK